MNLNLNCSLDYLIYEDPLFRPLGLLSYRNDIVLIMIILIKFYLNEFFKPLI